MNADNYGDDEADDLGIGKKPKRLVRNKLAVKSFFNLKFLFAVTKYDLYCNYVKVYRLAVAAKSMRHYEFTFSRDVAVSS